MTKAPTTTFKQYPFSESKNMGSKSPHLSFLLLSILLLLHEVVTAEDAVASSESEALGLEGRESLEIVIGIGGGTPSPSSGGCPPPPPPPPKQKPLTTRLDKARRVLLNFKKFIVDPTGYTRNWNSNTTDTCEFHGIRCATYPNTSEQAVAGLDFNQAQLSGLNCSPLPLSGILDSIPELTFFHVNSNNFSGSVPKIEVNKIPFFFELDLSNNKLVGEFPKEVLQATELVFLDLRFNKLYGPLPSQLFEMDLDVIFINNNQFGQFLLENFGSTPARYLTFANNQFKGPIPRSIGEASQSLTEVLFLGNRFQGCLPFEIGYLKKLTVFDVSKNLLTGPIPYSFGCLEKIQLLNLADNKFYGPVPENLCVLPGLRNNGNLSLSNNYFTAIGPECWKLLKSGVLDVSRNCIWGLPNQRSHQECYEFLHKVKPCPNSNENLLYYIPCEAQWKNQQQNSTAPASPPEPVIYNSLKPHHRLRL